MQSSPRIYASALILTFVLTTLVYSEGAKPSRAAEADELRKKIEERNRGISEIESEIKRYEQELNSIGKEKQTLEGTLRSLDISRQKISADIRLTENKIGVTDTEISNLTADIADKERRIALNMSAVAQSIRAIHALESNSFIEALLANDELSDVWDQIETHERLQIVMRDNVKELSVLRDEFSEKKAASLDKKQQLKGFQQELSDQKQVLDVNRSEKNELLSTTKSKEVSFQGLLAEKRAAREQLERELTEFESQLQYVLDPNTLPPVGRGVLKWPLDAIRITQHFGNTAFAQGGAYNGQGHNGVDFAASRGTRVKSALTGTIAGVGNTDAIPGCYSYGKWVLVRHNNGLATLYAHLDLISVSRGDDVKTGGIVGYSGNTGYSTGPHLHFTVYVAEAVQIVRLGDIKTITNCANAYIPVAPLNAYLNPLDYL